jgi:ParB family transcriptional regulator, chromosome partitioning protein
MIKKVKISEIKPNPFQHRKGRDLESIESLAKEIDKVGLWAGALRGRLNNGHVELCFGHRRLEALKLLKRKEVEVDVVKLTDEEMSIQALIENLQREGLNDADKGEGFAAYIKLRLASQNGKSMLLPIKDELSRAIGLTVGRIDQLLQIANFQEDTKDVIRSGKIAGSMATEVFRVGGEEAVKTIAKKEVQPSRTTVKEIGKKIREVETPAVQEQLKKEFAEGKIDTPEEVVKRARREEAKRQKKDDLPPDLVVVIATWTAQMKEWTGQLDQVLPYLDYIDTAPKIADAFRKATKILIERLEKFI